MTQLLFQFSDLIKYTDVFIVVFFFVLLVIGKKKGFINQIIGFAAIVASIVLGALLAKPLFNYLQANTTWFNSLKNYLSEWATESFPDFTSINADNLSTLVTNLPFPSAVKQTILSYAQNSGQETVNLSAIIAETLFRYIGVGVCFLVISLTVKIVFVIIKKLLNALKAVTLIRWIDELLGIVLMMLKGLAVLYVLCFIINVLPIQGFEAGRQIISQSFILRNLTNYNLFAYLLSFIKI
ncbi:MAG: CvpA family protein [Christensenellaceae bacterium]